MVNWSAIESGWDDYKANAREQWSKLSDDQLTDTQGNRDDLSSQVQQAYAVSKEDAERQITEWQSKQMHKRVPAANT